MGVVHEGSLVPSGAGAAPGQQNESMGFSARAAPAHQMMRGEWSCTSDGGVNGVARPKRRAPGGGFDWLLGADTCCDT